MLLAPQGVVGSGATIVSPLNAVLKLSEKEMSVISPLLLMFASINLSVAMSPGRYGLSRNSLSKVMPATTKSLVTAAPVTGNPPTVAVTALVVLVSDAGVDAAGTSSVTLNTHSSPGASVPPIKVSSVSPAEPVNDDPAPHGGSGNTGRFAVKPARAAFKSSVKEIFVAGPAASAE